MNNRVGFGFLNILTCAMLIGIAKHYGPRLLFVALLYLNVNNHSGHNYNYNNEQQQ